MVQGQFPILRLREFLRREAAVYAELGLPNYVGVHKSTTMMPPCYSFATFAIDGEQRFMTNPALDYVDQFPPDYIRAHIMGRQFGLVPIFLSEIRLDKKYDSAMVAANRGMFAVLLPHEIPVWPGYGIDAPTLTRIDQIKGNFGYGQPDVVFHPYWETNPVVHTGDSTVKASLWKRPKQILMVVSNLGEARQVTLKIDFSRLGSSPRKIKDAESGEILSGKGDGILLRIPRHDFRLLEIR
jgi:hypothetical protein